jgi:hypothetical protein
MPNRAHAQFQPGEFITWDQDSWGGTPNPGNAAYLLAHQFDLRFPGSVQVGVSGAAGYSAVFTSAQSVLVYLPATGLPGPLTANLLNPTSTPSGAFGGFLLAITFSVDFADAGLLVGSTSEKFGDLRLTNMANVGLPALDGMTVRQFRDFANLRVAGVDGQYTIDEGEIVVVASGLQGAFEGGQPSQFAQDHLRIAPPGDFDNDGDADGGDFLKWQQALGSADPKVDGNGNNNGVVDGWDLAIWASNFGAPAAGTAAAVPEPTAGALARIGLLGLTVRRRKAPC